MSYSFTSANVPLPQGTSSAALLSSCSNSATSAPGESTFTSYFTQTDLNQLLARIANAISFGGAGAYGVVSGLTLSAGSGLVANVDSGVGQAGQSLQYAGGSLALADNSTNRVWLTQGGTLASVTDTSVPTGGVLFIGVLLTSGGAITGSADYSGVMYIANGKAQRNTADYGAPTDSPASYLHFLTRTNYGLWQWTGAEYLRVDTPGPVTVNYPSDADLTLTRAQYEASVIYVTDSESHLTATRKLIFPAVTTPSIAVVNKTAQTVTAKPATGATLDVATSTAQFLTVTPTGIQAANAASSYV